MSGLEVFDYAGQQVRTVLVDGEPWFVTADVARILGYRDAHNLARRLDEDEKGTHSASTPGGSQQVSTISESGLFSAILGSQLVEAAPFKRWVTHEVLPSIRKTGSYSVVAAPELTREQLVAKALLASNEIVLEMSAKIAQLQPSADAWDSLAALDGDLSVREAAQALSRDAGISVGQNRLFDYLREIGWIDRKNSPYQSQIDCGRLTRRVSDYTDRDGQQFVTVQARITPKGLAELRKRLTAPNLRLVASTA